MIADAPLNWLSMRHVPEKSAANAAPGASTTKASSRFILIGALRHGGDVQTLRDGAHHTEVEICPRSRDPCLMSTNEDRAPLGAAPDSASPQNGAAPADETPDTPPATEAAQASSHTAANPHDSLSPAVRRLVRQFDLDITGIHGTGPEGRIRVGDVMGLLGGRTDAGTRGVPARVAPPDSDGEEPSDEKPRAVERAATLTAPPPAA